MELSVSEIIDKVIGKDTGSRALPFRYLPKEIVQTSKNHLEKTDDVEKVLRYVINSFYIYRECVNRSMFAPHYDVDNEYEWLKPVEFSWSDIETVILGGESLYGKIPRENKGIIIETPMGDKTEIKTINPETGKINKYFRETISEDVDKTLKFNIESLSKVGAVFSDWWQIAALKGYANPVYFLLDDFLKKNRSKDEVRIHLTNQLNGLETSCINFNEI
ncbi:MAG: hypothetical protein Q8N63_07270 [Nanoarchaeota archaeon]|nr:hypothetical protein [Nanoarchaeota archaeon]